MRSRLRAPPCGWRPARPGTGRRGRWSDSPRITYDGGGPIRKISHVHCLFAVPKTRADRGRRRLGPRSAIQPSVCPARTPLPASARRTSRLPSPVLRVWRATADDHWRPGDSRDLFRAQVIWATQRPTHEKRVPDHVRRLKHPPARSNPRRAPLCQPVAQQGVRCCWHPASRESRSR